MVKKSVIKISNAQLSKKILFIAFNTILFSAIAGISLYLLYNLFYPSLQEGIVLTPYDNSKLFTKPWDKFCIPFPPSCQKNLLQGPAEQGSPHIGCNCTAINEAVSPPAIPNSCYNINYDHFY